MRLFANQKGFLNITTLALLGLVMAGMGFLYYKGYRLDIKTHSGVGPVSSNQNNSTGRNNGDQQNGLFYTVQVSVTPVESNAINIVNNLQSDGYDAYYDTYSSDQGRVYKVRLGQYADQQSASAVKSQVRRRYDQFKDSFVKTITE
ncbi:MAG: Unknown protein [uncultured Thiotrichaceae bacterium]|uniref:SPOR domain-containing protein n=1 Tax=uncultured Thiotrichaceae bacterium TaxID=298394 RepID=A0A6S6SJB6_9GAMM|nr:MAG: Unknown protein [uncultured Thiotrichaceae bacterium]